MIKNVIFDLGQVLINYKPRELLDSFGLASEQGEELFNGVFGSKLWLELDKGALLFQDACEIYCRELPAYAEYIERIFTEDSKSLLFDEMKETVKFMRKLKADGYMIYLLSNFSSEGFTYVEKKFPFISEAHGRIISAHVKSIKPEPEIYKALLDKYSLVPSECVFFDDLEKNCAGAEACGIKAIQFLELDEAVRKFEELVAKR